MLSDQWLEVEHDDAFRESSYFQVLRAGDLQPHLVPKEALLSKDVVPNPCFVLGWLDEIRVLLTRGLDTGPTFLVTMEQVEGGRRNTRYSKGTERPLYHHDETGILYQEYKELRRQSSGSA